MRKLLKYLLNLPNHYRVIPCYYKRPLIAQWQKSSHNYSPQELFQTILHQKGVFTCQKKQYPVTGIGLITGHYAEGYLIALDCDTPIACSFIEELNFPTSLSFTSNPWLEPVVRKQVFYFVEQYIPSFKDSILKLEVRGKGHFSMLPPSIHPKGSEYRWLNRKDIAHLPSELILDYLQVPKRKSSLLPRPNDSPQQIKQAIALIKNIDIIYGDDYWQWLSIGMALKNVSPCLLPWWDEWSSRCNKYKHGECAYKWQGFNQQGYSISTLYHFYLLSTNNLYRKKYEHRLKHSRTSQKS